MEILKWKFSKYFSNCLVAKSRFSLLDHTSSSSSLVSIRDLETEKEEEPKEKNRMVKGFQRDSERINLGRSRRQKYQRLFKHIWDHWRSIHFD